MAGRKGSQLRVVVLVGGLLGLAFSLAIIGVSLRNRGLTVTANVAQLVSVVLAVPSLAVGLVVWWRRSAAPAAAPGTSEVLRAKDVLAGLVAEQWQHEARLRSLDDPDPIPVRWRTPEQSPTATTVLMDHPANIEPATGPEGEVWWSASSADIAALSDRFRRTRRRRLVILGGTGTGKTTLAMQLLLHLLETHTPDEPVPVLLPVAGWDTDQFPRLHDWLADRLARDYPVLRSPELGVEVVRTLTGRGHILPVLDGLDELPSPAQAKVITALNRSLGGGDQLILTSRTTEFTAAVTRAGDVVTSAAVLEPLPLAPADAADYLTRWLPPRPGSGWQQTLTELRNAQPASQNPPGAAMSRPRVALADVAATPLGLWLLRSVYSTPSTDPAELADPARFPDSAALRAHLFDQIIPALIDTRPPSNSPAEPFRPRRRHDPAQVRRWLGYLAHHLNQIPNEDGRTGTRDFAWWQLARHTLKPHAFRLVVGLVFGLVGGIGFGLLAAALGLEGLTFGPVIGLVFGVAFGWDAPTWLGTAPGFVKISLAGRSASLIKRGLAVRLVVGVVFALVILLMSEFPSESTLGKGLVGVPLGVLMVLVTEFINRAETPAAEGQVSTPLITWRADRSLNLFRTITMTATMWLMFALAAPFADGFWANYEGRLLDVLVSVLLIGLFVGLLYGFGSGRHRAWLAYLVATYRLAWTRRLPRRLMPFLDEMHRLGLLRAVGPIYQFRHAELQDHLAAAYNSRKQADER